MVNAFNLKVNYTKPEYAIAYTFQLQLLTE